MTGVVAPIAEPPSAARTLVNVLSMGSFPHHFIQSNSE
jgi:hypothetical protein